MIRVIKGIIFLFSSRGISRWVRRLISINRRFGFTPRKQMNIIGQYVSCLRQNGIKGTFFIPAVLLKRHLDCLRSIDRATIEWGIHGLNHTDHSMLDYKKQKAQLTKAVEIFDDGGIPFTGFRCPYLRFNPDTRKILNEIGRFSYDSSSPVVWCEAYGPDNRNFQWIKDFYKAQDYQRNALFPYSIGEICEIPVSLPDDDILADRERLDPKKIFMIWSSVLKSCHDHKEVFVLQLHPERFLELKEVLQGLIQEAKSFNPPIWITTLSEVAFRTQQVHPFRSPEPYQGALCITGDIDAVTINDFFVRLKNW